MLEELFEAAKSAATRAYAPYSNNYRVGAAIRSASGNIHAGCNIENVSFPEGWCAETTAIAHMIMAGENQIEEVVVYAQKAARATPCGGCRQRLKEFSTNATKVHLCDDNGVVETLTMADLLPSAFDMEKPS